MRDYWILMKNLASFQYFVVILYDKELLRGRAFYPLLLITNIIDN